MLIPIRPQFIPNTHLSQWIINKNIQKSHRESIIFHGTHNYSLFIKIFAREYLKVMTSIWLIISCWIISKHFKMYITINDVIGEKTIDLSYPIHCGREALVLAPHLAVGSCSTEVAVVSMFSNNVLYWLQGPIEVLLKMGKKIVLNKGVYTDKELIL